MVGPYSIIGEFYAHDGPIRSLCIGPLGEVVSGCQSDSPHAKKWNIVGKAFESSGSPIFHDHWVTAVTSSVLMGFVITGCMDSMIRVYDKVGNPAMVLEGHTKGVISFSWTANGLLISGSWDGCAKVWDLSQNGKLVHSLGPHENGVHVLGLSDGRIATTSTGEAVNGKPANFKLRFWSSNTGQQIGESISDHSGSIRSIISIPGVAGCATTSNDGTVALRGPDGSIVGSMMHPPQEDGSPPFVLDCSFLHTDTGMSLVSGAEDGSVMVCDGVNVLQNIPHPTCVWCVLGLPNTDGDFITGGHDGVLRYFSKDPQLISNDASISLQHAFIEQTATANAKKRQGPSNEEIEKQAKWEARGSHHGKSEGQVMVFNKDGKMIAAQWSADSATWIEIGEVTGNGDGGDVNGVRYDHVLPVEIDTPSDGVRSLSIGYNNLESAYDAAQRFIDENGLGQHYLRQIADWISDRAGKNTPTLGATNGSSSTTSSNSNAVKSYKYYPVKAFTLYDEIPAGFQGKIMPKITEFNSLSGDSTVSAVELESVNETVSTLTATSRYHSSSITLKQLNGILKMALQWESSKIFPAADICRMLGLHPHGAKSLAAHPMLSSMLSRILNLLKEGTDIPVNTVVTTIRFLVNSFRFDELRQSVLATISYADIFDIVEIQSLNTSKLIRTSVAALLLNCTVYISSLSVTLGDSAAPLLARSISLSNNLLMKENENSEVVMRSLLTIGTIAFYARTISQTTVVMHLSTLISSLDLSNTLVLIKGRWSSKLGNPGIECLEELTQMLIL